MSHVDRALDLVLPRTGTMTPVAEIVGAEGRGVNVDAKRHAGAREEPDGYLKVAATKTRFDNQTCRVRR